MLVGVKPWRPLDSIVEEYKQNPLDYAFSKNKEQVLNYMTYICSIPCSYYEFKVCLKNRNRLTNPQDIEAKIMSKRVYNDSTEIVVYKFFCGLDKPIRVSFELENHFKFLLMLSDARYTEEEIAWMYGCSKSYISKQFKLLYPHQQGYFE